MFLRALWAFPLIIVLGLTSPDDFKRERSGRSDASKDVLEGKAPPALAPGTWFNDGGKKIDWESLRGKVVVLDFWAHWCGPCREAVPHVKELLAKYGPKGLVFIAVHSDPNQAKMLEVSKQLGMNWPILLDGKKSVWKAFAADSFPDYYIIDRQGILRFADIANEEVDRAVEMLIEEKG